MIQERIYYLFFDKKLLQDILKDGFKGSIDDEEPYNLFTDTLNNSNKNDQIKKIADFIF